MNFVNFLDKEQDLGQPGLLTRNESKTIDHPVESKTDKKNDLSRSQCVDLLNCSLGLVKFNASTVTHDSVKLQWTFPSGWDSAVFFNPGYEFGWKKTNDNASTYHWEEVYRGLDCYIIDGLEASTEYTFLMQAFNDYAISPVPQPVHVATLENTQIVSFIHSSYEFGQGGPWAPDAENFLEVKPTTITLKLNEWYEEYWDITEISVSYKQTLRNVWRQYTPKRYSNSDDESKYVIRWLIPAMEYDLKIEVLAMNEDISGKCSTLAIYKVKTQQINEPCS